MKEKNGLKISRQTQLQYAMRCIEKNPDAVFWSNEKGKITYVNDAACKKLGYSKKELLGKNIMDLDGSLSIEQISNLKEATSKGELFRLKTIHRHKDGHLIPVEISMGQLDCGKNQLGFSFVRDMTEHVKSENELKQAYRELEKNNLELNKLYHDISLRENQLKYLAYHDTLTGLSNRTLLMRALNFLISENNEGKFALLFIDMDNFKNINDSLGHGVGDTILNEAGKRLQNNLWENESIYRFGGDEFIILLPRINSKNDIMQCCSRIKEGLLAPVSSDLLTIYLTCSIGVSVFPDDAVSAEELLMYADAAMYKAKAEGKNRIQFYNNGMKKDVISKIELQNKLRFAMEEEEFYIQYQPQFNLKTGRIRGLEALVRWNNLSYGQIAPNDFIPVMEELGLIIPIGKWIIWRACHEARKWETEYNFSGNISVNISAKQLKNDDFVNSVHDAILGTGLNPKRLELEITESIFIDSFESAVSKLMALKELGIRVSLDDFGTGYSSLGYLMQLPIDTLKIDKSFVRQIGSGSGKSHFISSVVSLVNDLGMETIVEGIETMEQFEYICQTKTDFVQGFLLSKPIMAEEIGEMIKKSNGGISFNGMIQSGTNEQLVIF